MARTTKSATRKNGAMKTCGDFGGRNKAGQPCRRHTLDGRCEKHRENPTVKPGIPEQAIIDAILRNHGLLSVAARNLGIDRKTIYNRAAKSEVVREAITEARELTCDIAEAALFKQIQAGEGWATCFYLKCQGKDRGYIERTQHEHTGRDGGPIQTEERVVFYVPENARLIAGSAKDKRKAAVASGNGRR